MIISVLGKGGSGKTSVSTQLALSLQEQSQVLAIDADHNMDFAFNVTAGNVPEMSYLGEALPDALKHVGLANDDSYTKAFLEKTSTRFSFGDTKDQFTNAYTTVVNSRMHLMASGPQTDKVLYGKACSHFLSTPLKLYLPLLELSGGSVAVIDEKAGADGASTGIVSGVDLAIVVSEPSLHGVKTANQIAELLDFFDTPYLFVGNKVSSQEDEDFLSAELVDEPVVFLDNKAEIKRSPFSPLSEWKTKISTLLSAARGINNNDRLARTIRKFSRNASLSDT